MACLLYLTSLYCKRRHIELVPEKTKLLVWSLPAQLQKIDLIKLNCPLKIGSISIEYSSFAEHVGILRSVAGGNMPHILDRISSHKRAMASVLHVGVARHHCANPSASLKLEKMYGGPVLMSGLCSLYLNSKEIGVLHRHHRVTLCRLQKLAPTTPDCVVFFLAGSLPGTAILHLQQLSLLGMIARLGPDSILQQLGRQVLLLSKQQRSWFSLVRSACQQYGLPDPLLIFQCPPGKDSARQR